MRGRSVLMVPLPNRCVVVVVPSDQRVIVPLPNSWVIVGAALSTCPRLLSGETSKNCDQGTRMTEADLVRRAKRGERSAFAEIYRTHQPAIYRYIRYRVHDE